jgi:hypothetical protein
MGVRGIRKIAWLFEPPLPAVDALAFWAIEVMAKEYIEKLSKITNEMGLNDSVEKLPSKVSGRLRPKLMGRIHPSTV